jgi:hypothetical protein
VVNQIRVHRELPREEQWVVVAATDPANVYGVCFPWPAGNENGAQRPARSVGANVVLERGRPLVWFTRGLRQVYLFVPPEDCRNDKTLVRMAEVLRDHADHQSGAAVEQINGEAPSTWLNAHLSTSSSVEGSQTAEVEHWAQRFTRALCDAGFENRPSGLVRRRHAALLRRRHAHSETPET